MFDKKKLEHFLKRLEVETHYPMEAPKSAKIVPAERSALDKLMDKYDLFTQLKYRNVGTPEMPIWAPPEDNGHITMAMLQNAFYQLHPMTYAGVARSSMWYMPWNMGEERNDSLPPAPTPFERLKHKVRNLNKAQPVTLSKPEAPARPERSPDYVHTITAWRGWGVRYGRLTSLGTEADWIPKHAPRARCIHGDEHEAPKIDCACGFWSFKTRDLAVNGVRDYLDDLSVIGTVEIWGRVIECSRGYRSEFAYPKELWLLGNHDESLSWTYGVPVRRLEK